jgi:quercetin dioxygenase-like cupin family protein
MAEVKTPLEMISTQPASIVSQTLIDRVAGTVTLFAFDAGQALSEHTAPFDALVQVLEGEVEIRIAGAPHHLQAGQLIVMPGGEPHALRALSPFKMMLTMIRGK